MKWTKKTSDNFEDRRGRSSKGKKAVLGGGVIGIVALLLTMFGGQTGKTVGNLISQFTGQAGQSSTTETVKTRNLSQEEQTMGQFCEAVFVYNNETWQEIFRNSNATYQEPGMVLFDDQVQTGCGVGQAAMGPFYCPADSKVYMDLRFFEELHNRFGAKRGDFAIAYVIAHEMGHHIQNLTGVNQQTHKAKQGKSKAEANKISVAQELQADFYAGIWANRNKDLLEFGDIEEAISAAKAVGDDAIQKRTTGYVSPESFTHGTSKQRKEWFMKGYETGDISLGTIEKIYESIPY